MIKNKGIKLFGLMILSLLFLSLNANANTNIEIKECGYNNWDSNTNYILNFTDTSLTNAEYGSTCFDIRNTTSLNNINFTMIKPITITDLKLFYMARLDLYRNWEFNNFNINFTTYSVSERAGLFYGTTSKTQRNNYLNFTFNNLNIISNDNSGNLKSIFFLYGPRPNGREGSSCANGYYYTYYFRNIYFKNSKIFVKNSHIIDGYEDYYYEGYPCNAGRATWADITYYTDNSYFISHSAINGYQGGRDYNRNGEVARNHIFMKNSVFVKDKEDEGNYYYKVYYNGNNSLLKYVINNDTNHDNIADDSNIYNTGYTYYNLRDMNIKKTILNKTFLQDVKWGNHFINTNNNYYIINKNNLDTNGFITGTNDNNNFSFFDDTYLNNRQALDLGTSNNIICDNDLTSKCLFTDTNYVGVTSGDLRPIISLNSNNKISGAIIEKTNNGNNGQLLANSVDIVRNNIVLENNIINKNDNKNKNGDNQLIKLNVNNLKINNNTFNIGGSTSSHYEIFDIKGDINSNKIYNNIFASGTTDSHSTDLFTNNCNVKFYNNKVDGSYTISSNCNNTNINPLVSYYNTDDNKVYYFYIGNYYNDYSPSCDDTNADGFCDIPHTLGGYIDNYTLSEFPFNWKNHLFNAIKIVDNQDFNITIYVPEAQNLVYDLSSQEDFLNFQFKHNSNFTDLNCDYIINGQPLKHISNVNNSIQSVNINNFDEGYYSFYVECYNDYKYKQSELYSFFVNYPGGQEPSGNYTNNNNNGNNNNTGTSDSGYSESHVNIIAETPKDTTDNLVNWIKDIANTTGSIGLTLGGFIIVVLLIGGVIGLLA